jgi:hypothetical protein
VIIMKTMRFLVGMAILAAVGAGLAGPAGAAEKAGRKADAPAVEKAERKAVAKPVKKEKAADKKSKRDTKLEVGKKNDVRKNGGARKKSA